MSLTQLVSAERESEQKAGDANPFRVREESLQSKRHDAAQAGANTFKAPAKTVESASAVERAAAPIVAPSESKSLMERLLGMIGLRRKSRSSARIALESVKVIRNDLSDSDLELVPVPKIKPVERVRARKPTRKKYHSGLVVDRLTARLFSLGRKWD